MHIINKIKNIIQKNNSLVCVGLDSEFSKIPAHLQNEQYPQFSFNKAIIEATHDLVCAYKPNTAFYEAQGEKGILELKMTCNYLKENYPEIDPYASDMKKLKESRKKLLELADYIIPGHGKMFKVEK